MRSRGRLGLGRTWQQARPFESLSVLDNLVVAARDYPAESLMRSLFRAAALRHAEAALRERARLC